MQGPESRCISILYAKGNANLETRRLGLMRGEYPDLLVGKQTDRWMDPRG